MASINLQNISQWKLWAIIKLLEIARTSSQITLPKILLALYVVFVLYGASYHSGGRVEAFFSFQAKKLSQDINMYL